MATFPCPFCRSTAVGVTGGGRIFLHYRCAACAEVWTAQVAAPAGRPNRHPRVQADRSADRVAPATKVLRH